MNEIDPNWTSTFALAEKAMLDGDHGYAVITLKKLLEITPESDKEYPSALEKLAESQWYLKNLQEAEKTNEILLEHWKKHSNHPGIVACLSNQALIRHQLNDLEKAEESYIEALREMRILLGPNHPYIGKLKSFYAQMLVSHDRDEEAEELGTAPREVTTLDWHPVSVITMFKRKLEKKEEEEENGQKENTEKSQEESQSPDEVSIKISSDESRMVFNSNRQTIKKAMRDGDYDKAERLWLFNLKLIFAFKLTGKLLFTAYERLAEIKYKQALLQESADYMKKSHDHKLETLDKNSPTLASSAESLARLYFELGDYEESEKLLAEAIRIYKKAHNKEHATVAIALNNLATILHVQKKYERAEKAYKDAIDIKYKVFGADHVETKRLLKSYAELLSATGRQSEVDQMDTEVDGIITGTWKGKSAKADFSGDTVACPRCGSQLQNGLCRHGTESN